MDLTIILIEVCHWCFRVNINQDNSILLILFPLTELIHGHERAFWWSKNVSRLFLCYLKLNNSLVDQNNIVFYPNNVDQSMLAYQYATVSMI